MCKSIGIFCTRLLITKYLSLSFCIKDLTASLSLTTKLRPMWHMFIQFIFVITFLTLKNSSSMHFETFRVQLKPEFLWTLRSLFVMRFPVLFRISNTSSILRDRDPDMLCVAQVSAWNDFSVLNIEYLHFCVSKIF